MNRTIKRHLRAMLNRIPPARRAIERRDDRREEERVDSLIGEWRVREAARKTGAES